MFKKLSFKQSLSIVGIINKHYNTIGEVILKLLPIYEEITEVFRREEKSEDVVVDKEKESEETKASEQ